MFGGAVGRRFGCIEMGERGLEVLGAGPRTGQHDEHYSPDLAGDDGMARLGERGAEAGQVDGLGPAATAGVVESMPQVIDQYVSLLIRPPRWAVGVNSPAP